MAGTAVLWPPSAEAACVPQEDGHLSKGAGMAVTPTNWPVLGCGSP